MLASPRLGGSHRWILEAKWALLTASLGSAAACALALGKGSWRPRTAAAGAAWGLAGAQALSAVWEGLGESAAFRCAELAALALAMAWASRCRRQARLLLGGMAGLGALTGALVIAQRSGRDPLGLLAGAHGPGAATFDHKGLSAAFLSIALGPALLFALGARDRGRWAAWTFLALITAGLSWSDTRAAWLGALASLVVLGLILRGTWSRKSMGLGLLVLAASGGLGLLTLSRAGLGGNLAQRALGILSTQDRNRQYRMAFWGASIEAWRERPWLGHAPGSFPEAVAPHAARLLRPSTWDGASPFAHNDFIQTGVEAGWLGVAALAFLGMVLVRSFARPSQEPSTRAACAAGLTAGAVNAMLAFPLFEPGCALALAILAGLLSAPEEEAPGRGEKRPGLAAVAALLTLLSLRLPLALGLSLSGHAERASALAPGLAQARLGAFGKARDRRDPPEAKRQLHEARRWHPRDSEVWASLGQVRWLEKDLPGARRSLDRAVALAPWNGLARLNLATLRFQQGDPPGAYADLERCLKELPDYAVLVHRSWGRLMALEGEDPLGAIEHLERSLADGGHPPTAEERAQCEAWIAGCRRRVSVRSP